MHDFDWISEENQSDTLTEDLATISYPGRVKRTELPAPVKQRNSKVSKAKLQIKIPKRDIT